MYSMNASILTKRRLAVLEFIQGQVAIQGQSPSLAEIAQACGFASRAAARKHVVALAEAGLVDIAPGKARGARPSGSKTRAELVRETSIFELSDKDVLALGDADLRELIAKVFLAAVVEAGVSPRHVTWSGDQRAADGGVDVQVQLPASTNVPDCPRPLTAYQVKATKMRPNEIQREMCPDGILRPVIRDIIKAKGAYIIVSAERVTGAALEKRREAMRAAAAFELDADQAEFDFYEARRIADLANRHPGVVAWARARIGKPIQGWRPYGPWASGNSDKVRPFLPDKEPRLFGPRGEPLSLYEGLERIRSLLTRGGQSVRLVGLSGVGKTRFVQALFESGIGNNELHESRAVYTDLSESALPPPVALVDELVANRKHAVVIVDNCSNSLHRQLADRCTKSSTVSLITIEYDINDDLAPETEVFRMEPASDELIVGVIQQRHSHVSQVDAHTISRIVGGNSRLALAIAATIEKGDTLANAKDDEVFERLFWQRKGESDALLRAAEACSLVYSFDGENETTELPRLAALAGTDVDTLYSLVATLQLRDLVQTRGVWRAVLPHAIANVLARSALKKVMPSKLRSHLIDEDGRLLRSFSRRLGFLNDDPRAKAIVREWLAAGGLLGDIATLDKDKIDILRNVAPTEPGHVLEAIERAGQSALFFEIADERKLTIVRLLRSIAYTAKYFERCMNLLLGFALVEPENTNSNSTRSLIASMFFARLSGTCASTRQRFEWIQKQLTSADPRIQRVACKCLDAALEAYHFTSWYGFEFGARSRNYGYAPRSSAEIGDWYTSFVDLLVAHAATRTDIAELLRRSFVRHFRSLWAIVRIYDTLENSIQLLMPFAREEIWLAIRKTLQFDGKAMPTQAQKRLQGQEALLRPQTLVEQTRAIVLTRDSTGIDIVDGENEGDGDGDPLRPYQRAEQRAEALGRLVANDAVSLDELLPDLTRNMQGRQGSFGRGLALGANAPLILWPRLVSAFGSTPLEARSVQVLTGFLSGMHDRDPATFESLLDQALTDPVIGEWYPILQTCVVLNERAAQRLLESLRRGFAGIERYQFIAYGSVTSELPGPTLAELIAKIARHGEEGVLIALEILSLYMHGRKDELDASLVAAGRDLVVFAPLHKANQRLDFELEDIVRKCLQGPVAEESARNLLTQLRAGLADFSLYPSDFTQLIRALLSVQPVAALDELVDADDDLLSRFARLRSLESGLEGGTNPFGVVETGTLIDWCRAGRPERWALVATVAPLFEATQDEPLRWSPTAVELVRQSPEPEKVLEELIDRLEPMSWSGSRAEIMVSRLPLFEALESLVAPDLNDVVRSHLSQYQERIRSERAWESERHREENERFE